MNEFTFVKAGAYIKSGLHGMRTNIVHYVDMDVLSAFEVILYLTAIGHVDGMGKDEKVNMHRAYAVGNRIGIAACPTRGNRSLVSRGW